MKKLPLVILSCLVLFSCSKKHDTTTTEPPVLSGSYISFKINGNLVTMGNANFLNGEQVEFAKDGSLPETEYLLNAVKEPTDVFAFGIASDSLQLTNYHYDINNIAGKVFTINYNGKASTLYYSGDYLDVNITSYANSYISGTFTAKFSPLANNIDYNRRGTTVITEGKLNDVPVNY